MLFVALVLVGCLALAASLYNRLRARSEAVKRGWSDLLGMMRKRATLVNQLVDICQGYGAHEKLTHIAISENTSSMTESATIARQANTVMDRVTALAANFPDLKANGTYEKLMGQIHAVENEIQARREGYNRSVEIYNTTRASFPAVFFAEKMGFPEAPYFSTDQDGLETPIAFRTDDGAMLRATMHRMGDSAAMRGRALAERAGQRIGHMREQRSTTDSGDIVATGQDAGHAPEHTLPASAIRSTAD